MGKIFSQLIDLLLTQTDVWLPGVQITLSSLVSAQRYVVCVSWKGVMLFSSQGPVWVVFGEGFWGVDGTHPPHTPDAYRMSKHPDVFFVNLCLNGFSYWSSILTEWSKMNKPLKILLAKHGTTTLLVIAEGANFMWTAQTAPELNT